MWGFVNFNFKKLAHNSNINLQVECDPLRKCARSRLAVCTGGAAKTRKGTNHKSQNQPNILTSKNNSLKKQKSQAINPNIYWKISIQRIYQIPAPHISQSYSP